LTSNHATTFKKIHGVWSLESGVWTPEKEVLGMYVLLCTLIVCLTTEARLSGDHLDSPWPLLQSPSKAKAKAKYTKQPNQEDSESFFVVSRLARMVSSLSHWVFCRKIISLPSPLKERIIIIIREPPP
jgi:hypothetical protein